MLRSKNKVVKCSIKLELTDEMKQKSRDEIKQLIGESFCKWVESGMKGILKV